jgi:tryptophanyl-tRNA synthetase
MTQFKDKAGKDREKASVGLYVYPNLMAADILLYQATHVPVGEDQKQHLELARDIAQKFNGDFNAPDFFPLPEPLILGQATRVMSLRDGSQKMSKSAPSDLSRITLNDTADDIAKKIRKAKTDPDALPETAAGLEGRPEAANLLGIFAALSDQSLDDAVAQFAGQQFSALKEQLTSVVIEKVAPITAEMNRLTDDPATIDAILADGAARARSLAEPIMSDVRKLVGFLSN